jgi:hypothetical protein
MTMIHRSAATSRSVKTKAKQVSCYSYRGWAGNNHSLFRSFVKATRPATGRGLLPLDRIRYADVPVGRWGGRCPRRPAFSFWGRHRVGSGRFAQQSQPSFTVVSSLCHGGSQAESHVLTWWLLQWRCWLILSYPSIIQRTRGSFSPRTFLIFIFFLLCLVGTRTNDLFPVPGN